MVGRRVGGEQELDYIQARGQMGAKSPLLWDEAEVASLLKGSPLAAEVLERLRVWAPFPTLAACARAFSACCMCS